MEFVNTFPLSAKNIEKLETSTAQSLMILLIAQLFNNKQRYGLNNAVYRVKFDEITVSEKIDIKYLAKTLGYEIKFEEVEDTKYFTRCMRITLSLPEFSEVNTLKFVSEE